MTVEQRGIGRILILTAILLDMISVFSEKKGFIEYFMTEDLERSWSMMYWHIHPKRGQHASIQRHRTSLGDTYNKALLLCVLTTLKSKGR